jgi:hypothetical protein
MLRGECRESTPWTIASITYQAPYEEVLSSPVTITDTAEPTDPQMQYTVQAADFPAMGMPCTPMIALYMAGKNNDASSRTLAYRFVKWSGSAWASLGSGSGSVAAGYYWTISAFGGPRSSATVAAGDIFGIKVWCTAGQPYFDYQYRAAQVQVTRIQPNVRRWVYKYLTVTAAIYPTLTQHPSGCTDYESSAGNLYSYHLDMQYSIINPGPDTISLIVPGPAYGLLRSYRGDWYSTFTNLLAHASRCPYYYANLLPTSLAYWRIPILVG